MYLVPLYKLQWSIAFQRCVPCDRDLKVFCRKYFTFNRMLPFKVFVDIGNRQRANAGLLPITNRLQWLQFLTNKLSKQQTGSWQMARPNPLKTEKSILQDWKCSLVTCIPWGCLSSLIISYCHTSLYHYQSC